MKSDFILWALLNRSDDFRTAVTRNVSCFGVFLWGGKVKIARDPSACGIVKGNLMSK